MKSARQIRRLAKQIRIEPDAGVDQRVLGLAEAALAESMKNKAVFGRPNSIRSLIMQSKTRKYAAVVAVAILLLIPLSYGAVRALKYFIVLQDRVEYHQGNGHVTVMSSAQGIIGDNIHTQQDAARVMEEFKKLYKKGKAEQTKLGLWSVTLSDGSGFNYGGDPEMLFLSDAKTQELLKNQFDEVRELRKAGKFEKTYKPEHDFAVDDVKYRSFEATYTLSDGRVVTMGESEPAEQK